MIWRKRTFLFMDGDVKDTAFREIRPHLLLGSTLLSKEVDSRNNPVNFLIQQTNGVDYPPISGEHHYLNMTNATRGEVEGDHSCFTANILVTQFY